jgi:hypothetical protein
MRRAEGIVERLLHESVDEMAKLSARGRTEILRFSKELPGDEGTTRGQRVYAFMSDGKILVKTKVWFKPDQYSGGKERPHDWGWNLTASKHDPEKANETRSTMLSKGYKEEPVR